MHEQLIADLMALKQSIVRANNDVYTAAHELIVAKDALRAKEDSVTVEGLIDGKNAEIRASQLRQYTVIERQEVAEAEDYLENAKTTLSNLRTELQINLALVELVKGVA
ncbi:hypothetical protein REC12_11295 [Desulfosporosinus sp. PR]|uniref:hypothetical protein n=1 Tax=Candidatus Desulfosporosinus nitrosoreducens TaxID=3401928 RepID=UPI0027EE0B5B|nr:hypothetical protein [Desulfosporosinus sp. PR]MDQ7094174.1 hypothetical protein [Desulfosporosinus sp. PR]